MSVIRFKKKQKIAYSDFTYSSSICFVSCGYFWPFVPPPTPAWKIIMFLKYGSSNVILGKCFCITYTTEPGNRDLAPHLTNYTPTEIEKEVVSNSFHLLTPF